MRVETATWEPATGWAPSLPQPDDRPTLVLVFGHDPLDDEARAAIADLASTWREHAVLGCSTPAQLPTGATEAALSVTVARFDHTAVRASRIDVAQAGGARGAGRALADAMAVAGLRGVLVLADGGVNGAALAGGFAEHLPDVPLAGGIAGGSGSGFATGFAGGPGSVGDQGETGGGWTLVDGGCRTGHVTAVGFVGDRIELGFGSGGGWDVLGPERLVTQCYGNVLYELDGRPALTLYADHLDVDVDAVADLAPAFPMSIRDLDDRTVIRGVSAANPTTESLRLAGDVPQGAIAQLLQACPEHLVHGAHVAAQQAAIADASLAIAISCVSRRAVLGPRSAEELVAVADAGDGGAALTGFYAVGSLAPAPGGSDHHNQMMSITTIREHGLSEDGVAA